MGKKKCCEKYKKKGTTCKCCPLISSIPEARLTGTGDTATKKKKKKKDKKKEKKKDKKKKGKK